MFFIVSKVAGPIFEPVTFLILVGLLGLALWGTKLASWGRGLVAASILPIAIAAFSPLANLLLRPLEDRFPPLPPGMAAPDGIVVLGGALNEDLTAARHSPSLSEAAARLTEGAVLARRYPNARLIFTGGSSRLRASGPDEASGVRQLWLALGVPASQLSFEDKSRNTFENATMTRALAAPKPGERWLLVTSAAHMPRAMGIFRKVGWPMIADPVDYRTFGDARDTRPSLATTAHITNLEVAVHEWAGLVAYRLSGKTDALFPAP